MEHIVRDYGIVVITRGGSDPMKMVYENDMLSKYSQNIHIITDWIGDDFSSTKVRYVSSQSKGSHSNSVGVFGAGCETPPDLEADH